MPATTEPPASPHRRSGTLFVLACGAVCVGLVLVMVFVSPQLLEATLARAPDQPPVAVADGDADGQRWTATAVEPDEDVPCLDVAVDDTPALQVCGDDRGPSNVRALDGLALGDTVIVATIVDPHSTAVWIDHAGGTTRADVVYADYGFPLGFAAAAVEAPVVEVTAAGEDELRGRADCRLDGEDHDPAHHLVPPIVVASSPALGGGCLLTD